jgi:hypothetical protein
LTSPINERKCYVFCRDSENKFAPKYYSEPPHHDELAERDAAGRLRANAPDSASNDYGYTDYLVNVDYLNRKLQSKADASRITALEARIAELEARLATIA